MGEEQRGHDLREAVVRCPLYIGHATATSWGCRRDGQKRVFMAALCFATLLLLHPAHRVSATPVTYSFFPARPASSSELSATVGTVDDYHVYGGSVSYATLTINDETTRAKRTFYIALPFHVNGKIVQCAGKPDNNRYSAIAQLHVCSKLPHIVDHTRLVVLYWPVNAVAFFKDGFATDSLTLVQPAPKSDV